MTIYFTNTHIRFNSYPFKMSTLSQHGRLPYTDILDVDPRQAPPEIRTIRGETVFIPATVRDQFQAEIAGHRWPTVYRVDVWALLLEPFLDTVMSDDHQANTLKLLEMCHLSQPDVATIRQAVGSAMLSYNSMMWDWVHLGLYDLLMAIGSSSTPPILPAIQTTGQSFGMGKQSRAGRFYAQAMRIAELGRI